MRFKIIKIVDNIETWYWTVPKNIFLRLWFGNLIISLLYSNTQNPYDVWLSKEKALQHIKRWNSGYYKKIYYKEEIK